MVVSSAILQMCLQDVGTLTFQINVGTLITIGMGILQRGNKLRHPNNRRHDNFTKKNDKFKLCFKWKLTKVLKLV